MGEIGTELFDRIQIERWHAIYPIALMLKPRHLFTVSDVYLWNMNEHIKDKQAKAKCYYHNIKIM